MWVNKTKLKKKKTPKCTFRVFCFHIFHDFFLPLHCKWATHGRKDIFIGWWWWWSPNIHKQKPKNFFFFLDMVNQTWWWWLKFMDLCCVSEFVYIYVWRRKIVLIIIIIGVYTNRKSIFVYFFCFVYKCLFLVNFWHYVEFLFLFFFSLSRQCFCQLKIDKKKFFTSFFTHSKSMMTTTD